MAGQNPLDISPKHGTPYKKNPRGRRRKSQSIILSSQPKSIVSQILQKMLIENKVVLPIEPSSYGNDVESSPIIIDDETDKSSDEADQIEEYCSSVPKPKIFKRSVEEKEPRIYSCDFPNCVYSTKLSCNLHKHNRTHTGEKPYLCDRCSFRTNFSNSLKVHRRLHTNERPYQCTHCHYRCNSISNLKKHSRTKHRDIKGSNEDTQISKCAK